MRIIGIDPGSIKTGWGVIERNGNRISPVNAGVIRTKRGAPLHERLVMIHEGLAEQITTHQPEIAAVEQIFQAKFASSALKLGQARGVALLAVAQAELPFEEYPPNLVKRTVTGAGHADKKQVAQLVSAILGLTKVPAEDACDALAVAITCAQATRANR